MVESSSKFRESVPPVCGVLGGIDGLIAGGPALALAEGFAFYILSKAVVDK